MLIRTTKFNDISQQDENELEFYQKVENDKQKEVYYMTLLRVNKLAVSSGEDINIYSFDVIKKYFNVIKTLRGHTESVNAIKIMKRSKNLLLSCSEDNDCRLWNISQEDCLKVFKGHSDGVNSIQILSDKIFVSASAEIIFWNIESKEIIHSIQVDKSKNQIISLIKSSRNKLICAGTHNFIGFIKI